jgi:hypothetical protein
MRIIAQDTCPVVKKEHLSTEKESAGVAAIKRHVPFEIFWQLKVTHFVHGMLQNATYMCVIKKFWKLR